MNLSIAIGTARTSKKWINKSLSWDTITEKLSTVKRTAETVEQYKAMTKDQRGDVKDLGGFVGGALTADGPRNSNTIASRTLLTLDVDYGRSDTLGVIKDALAGWEWCLYSTHSHTPDAPRYRLVLPMDRAVTPDEYIPVARKVAETIGMDYFDDSTYQPHRLMYWPSAPTDGEFVYEHERGTVLSADEMLSEYKDWTDTTEWPMSSRELKPVRKSTRKQEDPTSKTGIIGAFCKTYTISDAIHKFLPDCYEQTDIPGRWTYLKGTTSAGAIVYEDKWLYSHHGTDPCCEREVNAFDLVRIHKFGDRDSGAKADCPVNRLPSYKAMEDLVNADEAARSTLTREAFRDMTDLTDEELEARKDDIKWTEALRWDDKGKVILPCAYNYDLISRNDEGLKDAVRYNVFLDHNEIQRDLPWAKKTEDHPYWTDMDDAGMITYLSQAYPKMSISKTTLLDAHDFVMSQTAYHPIREYLNSLKWDGVRRVDTMLIDYLGATDDPDGLTRAMTRKHMAAAVARVYKPGTKFDYVLTLAGPEGAGKSTLIRRLGKRWFNDSFSSADIGDKQAMEQIRGTWLNELGELSAYKRNVVDSFKAFISKTEDEYRPAYGRKKVNIKRQCVFWATTNETTFLKGDTGNRRFWLVPVCEDLPERDVFSMTEEDVDQIWAETVQIYRQGEELYLDEALEKRARARQEAYNESVMDERPGIIEAFLRRPLPENWPSYTREQRALYFRGIGRQEDSLAQTPTVRRKYISAAEIGNECFHKDLNRYESKEIMGILRGIEGLEFVGPIRTADDCYGIQRRFRITEQFWSKSTLQ